MVEKKPHEIALEKIEREIRSLGYNVKQVHEPIEKDKITADSLAFHNYLSITLPNYETVRIKAEYECLDTDTWEYSETEIDEIAIIAHLEIISTAAPEAVGINPHDECEKEYGRFRQEQARVIEKIKELGYQARLHFNYSIKYPRSPRKATKATKYSSKALDSQDCYASQSISRPV